MIEKLKLQSDILTSKYTLMLEIDEDLKDYPHLLSIEEFNLLDIETKLVALEEVEEYKWKNIKKIRKDRVKDLANLTPEEKVLHDLKII